MNLIVPAMFVCAAICVAVFLGVGAILIVQSIEEMVRQGNILIAIAASAAILFFLFLAAGWALDTYRS
jgi:hypothetical protein